ncbi:hypothetical protein [Luteimonas sp. TWI1437]|uniref:hypothetical protein n=1 Tax=unclassified Luteimonas TaxID=2629088 RepID=UPI00320B765C
MGKTNKAWHAQHRMPEHATAEQRIAWHRAHAAACGCRPPPPNILRQIEVRPDDHVDAVTQTPQGHSS